MLNLSRSFGSIGGEFGAIGEAVIFLDYLNDLPDLRQGGKVRCLLRKVGAPAPDVRPLEARERSNEIVAVSKPLDTGIEGDIVTIEAIGCRRDTALFLSSADRAMTRSEFEYIFIKHPRPPRPLNVYRREEGVTAHSAPHLCNAMLQATRDIGKVAPGSVTPAFRAPRPICGPTRRDVRAGRFLPPDKLLVMLSGR